jgi:hypothetical protein
VQVQVRSFSQTAVDRLQRCQLTPSGLRITHHASYPTSYSLSPLRPLSIHDRALNLIAPSREVLSIVWPELGNGPFHVVLTEPLSFYDLEICTVELDCSTASVWNARLGQRNGGICGDLRFSDLVAIVEERLTRFQAQCESPLFTLPNEPVQQLLQGLYTGDSSAVMAGAWALAGLGPGLTPSGDDFLVGLMAGLWLFPHNLAATFTVEEVCRLIVETAVPRTTTLSGVWLRHAARGEVGEAWHDLARAISSADTTSCASILNRILATGATSGADALAGFHHWVSVNACRSALMA